MTMEDASPIKDGGFVVVILVFGGVYNPGFLAPTHTGKATKGKVQDIGEVNKVMPLPQPSSVG